MYCAVTVGVSVMPQNSGMIQLGVMPTSQRGANENGLPEASQVVRVVVAGHSFCVNFTYLVSFHPSVPSNDRPPHASQLSVPSTPCAYALSALNTRVGPRPITVLGGTQTSPVPAGVHCCG